MNRNADCCIARRCFIKWGASALLTQFCASPILASIPPPPPTSQVLSFYNIHTREVLETCYRKNGYLVPYALQQVDRIMRDYRTGEVKPIDPDLLDLLHRIVTEVGTDSRVHIISGYRSLQTNEKLRKQTSGVARKSLHMQGRAIDIRIPGYPTVAIRNLAVSMQTGGVGYYPASDFVHLDTGRFRIW